MVTESGIHKVKNAKVIEKWYLSEQFNKQGQAVLYASHKPKKSNPWALLFREAGIEDTRSFWAEVNSYHGVRDRLNYMYDEEGYHFRIDGLKMGDKIELQPMAASWPIEYGFLVDYFLNAIRTNQITNNVWSTEAFVCAFKDKRIMNFVRELQRNEINNAFEAGVRKFNTKFCVGIQNAIGMN